MSKAKKSAPVRLDNIGVVVEDLAAAVAFFVALGLEIEGQTIVEGKSVTISSRSKAFAATSSCCERRTVTAGLS